LVHQLCEYRAAEIHPPFCVVAKSGHPGRFWSGRISNRKIRIRPQLTDTEELLRFQKRLAGQQCSSFRIRIRTRRSATSWRFTSRWALSVWVCLEIEKLNFGRKDSRVLRLLRRELAAAEDVAAALLKEESAVINLVPQTRHAPSGLEVRWGEGWGPRSGRITCHSDRSVWCEGTLAWR
jgi:hypothetical protein